jgi:hypothetical protein
MTIALALEASVRAAPGTRHPERSFSLLDRAEHLARSIGDPRAEGTVYLCRAYVDYLLGMVTEGIRDSRRAISFLRERCTGVAWELTAAHVLLFWFSCWNGSLNEVRETLPQLLKEGAARGDVNVEVSLRLLSYVHYAYLCADEPAECMAQAENALARWSQTGFLLQHYGALFIQVETLLYEGEYQQARERLISAWRPMSQSFILRWQILKIMALFLRGRVTLAVWLGEGGDALRAEIEDHAERLESIRSHWCVPMAGVLRAGLAKGDGDRVKAADLLEQASKAFENASLHAWASAAAHFSGVMRNDRHGQDLVKAARSFLDAQRVSNPEAFLRMLLPGTWAQ